MKYQVLPELTPIEYEALKADIAQRGVLVPIDVDEKGEILDGHHRVRAWNELQEGGIEVPSYPKIIRPGLTEEQKRNHARSLNVLRRQLSKDQRDQVMVDMRKDGMSYRQIAEATGASVGKVHDTVVQVFKNEHLESPVAIKGADGKQYPAQQEPKTQAPQISMFVPGSEVIIEPKAAEEAARQNKSEKSEVIRQSRVDKILEVSANNQPLEDSLGTFNILYADPPWRYEHSATDSRQIENQYPTMTLEDICALPVGEITESDAILFLWATSPKLAEAMHVIDAWGFTYRSCMVWDKERMGMGYYARQQHELLLIAARGNLPVPEAANRPRSVIRIERDEKHSAKPHEFYTLIEKMYPEYRRVELFARNERVGWAAWGNQSCITLENV